MTVQNEYRIRIPVEVDQTAPHIAAFRVATSAIVLDVIASNPAAAVEIVTRALDEAVAGAEGLGSVKPEPCHPGAACSKPEAKHATLAPTSLTAALALLDEARAQVADLEAQVARLSAFGEQLHRVREALEGAGQ